MKVDITLTMPGAEPVRTVGELRLLSTAARAGRAAGIMFMALALAVAIIPVPIIHLVGIPLVLLVGIGWAVRVSRSIAVLSRIRIPCPRCGSPNALGGGLGLRTTTGPLELTCESCRRVLVLTLDAMTRGAETSHRTSA